jgi:SAM-dependent methyltransferase
MCADARDRVLEVARGTGIVIQLEPEQLGAISQITGVDINPEMIAVARSIEPDVSWHRGNALELPFENRSFDVVLCQQGFQFFPRSRGRGPRNATRSRGGRPDRLKHMATARRKSSLLWPQQRRRGAFFFAQRQSPRRFREHFLRIVDITVPRSHLGERAIQAL